MLISISGIDGCGKTMQVQMLKGWLERNNKEVFVAKAYDEMAKVVCAPFVSSWNDDVAITFLFQALHSQQYTVAMEALERDCIVIADRWDESYLAYHKNFGVLSEDCEVRAALNRLAFRGRIPDLGFVIEVPPDVARKRRMSRGKMERLEDRPDEYYGKIQKTYLEIAQERNWYILDGKKVPEVIHEEIIERLNDVL